MITLGPLISSGPLFVLPKPAPECAEHTAITVATGEAIAKSVAGCSSAQLIDQSSEFHLQVAQRCRQSSRRNPGQLKLELQAAMVGRPMNTTPILTRRVVLSYFLLSWIDHWETTAQADQEGTGGTRSTKSTQRNGKAVASEQPALPTGADRRHRRCRRRESEPFRPFTNRATGAPKSPLKHHQNASKGPKTVLQTSLKKQNTLQNSPKKMWHVPQSQG